VASRLSNEAKASQIAISPRVLMAVEDAVVALAELEAGLIGAHQGGAGSN
jgi:hypothetical protein